MSRLLLDTHVFLWLHTEPHRLGALRVRLEDPSTELLLSAASSWEMAIKWSLGKLPLPEPPERYVPDRMQRTGIDALPVTHTHALAVAGLPRLHNDPFDRLLVVQAIHERLPIVTVDPLLAAYQVETIWPDA